MIIAPVLTAVALWAGGGPVEIHPTSDSYLGGHASIYLPGHVWLGETTIEAAARGDELAVLILLHEVGHTVGIEDEHQAMCFALRKLPTALSRFYGFRWRRVFAAYTRAAAYVRGLPPKYSQGACRPTL